MSTTALEALKSKAASRKFLLPSTNCGLILPNGRRIDAPDGVVDATTPELLVIMEELVQCGGAVPYTSPAQLTKMHDTSITSTSV